MHAHVYTHTSAQTHVRKQRHMCSEARDTEAAVQEGQACATWLNQVLCYVLFRGILLCCIPSQLTLPSPLLCVVSKLAVQYFVLAGSTALYILIHPRALESMSLEQRAKPVAPKRKAQPDAKLPKAEAKAKADSKAVPKRKTGKQSE